MAVLLVPVQGHPPQRLASVCALENIQPRLLSAVRARYKPYVVKQLVRIRKHSSLAREADTAELAYVQQLTALSESLSLCSWRTRREAVRDQNNLPERIIAAHTRSPLSRRWLSKLALGNGPQRREDCAAEGYTAGGCNQVLGKMFVSIRKMVSSHSSGFTPC